MWFAAALAAAELIACCAALIRSNKLGLAGLAVKEGCCFKLTLGHPPRHFTLTGAFSQMVLDVTPD